MSEYVCPICGTTQCTVPQPSTDGWSSYILCAKYGFQFCCADEILSAQEPIRYQLLNLIFEKLLRNPYKIVDGTRLKWHFFFNETYAMQDSDEPNFMNLSVGLKQYPSNVIDRINRVLLNLSVRYGQLGSHIEWQHGFEYRLLFCDSSHQPAEASQMLQYLKELGYIKGDPCGEDGAISFKGWEKIEELTKPLREDNQGFIAMSYASEAKTILETFRDAITDCGFVAQVIGEKEHNNQIAPEMFYEIERSKFMVVDVTYANLGAYYEAGYAQALGKQVIVCCRHTEFCSQEKALRPHFDIAQKAMVVWETESELKQKLIRRIQATVQ